MFTEIDSTLSSVPYLRFSVAISFDPFLITKENIDVMWLKICTEFVTGAIYPSILKLSSVSQET